VTEPSREAGQRYRDDAPSCDSVADPLALARRRFIAATVIDSVGSGLWLPFALLFLVHAQRLPLVDAGGALTIGGFAGLAFLPFIGGAIDQAGVLPVMVTCNLVRLVAFCCYPWVSQIWQVSLVSTVIVVGDRLFWTANTPMVNALTVGRESEHMFASQTVARYVGAGIGSGATVFLSVGHDAGVYHLLAYLNAASYAVAAVMIARLRVLPVAHAVRGGGRRATTGTWLALPRQRAYVSLCGMNVLFTIASYSKYLILSVLVVNVLHGPLWLPGAAVVVGTVVIVIGQQRITRYFSHRSRTRALLLAGFIYAASFATLASLTAIPRWAMIAVILAYSVGVSIAEAIFAPVTMAAAADIAPASMKGRASALYQLSWGISGVITPYMLTSLLAVSNAVLWLTLSALCLLAVFSAYLLRGVLATGPSQTVRRSGPATLAGRGATTGE